jgi:hypothetical protein
MLIFGGSALVAAFSPYESYPYWPAIPHLRTDTSGVLAFAVAAVSLSLSKYLELRRRNDRGDIPVNPLPGPRASTQCRQWPRRPSCAPPGS